MRRVALVISLLGLGALALALPALGDDGDGGDYLVRAIFDNGGFVVNDEEVRVAGASVGTVDSVDVSRDDEIVSIEDGPEARPGKAVIVLAITDEGFADFREDASCLIRPQSLIGEKYIDCVPTQPRAPGTEPPPELEVIPDGERGAGQRLLPVENNGKAIDLDLVQNIQRRSYRDRFRLLLNELGAGLAGRGEDLGAIVDRANPALRQTNRVLSILAQQNRKLADLARDGDRVLEPLARRKTSVTGFFANAARAGEATAERGDDLELALERFPATLREVRATMKSLGGFAEQGAPLLDDAGALAPHLKRATVQLRPFARAGVPALESLGDAAETAGPKLVDSDPLLKDLRRFANGSVAVGENAAGVLDTFRRTDGFKYLTDFIYNADGALNGFDEYGHSLRSRILVTSCIGITAFPTAGCEATFAATSDRLGSIIGKRAAAERDRPRAPGAGSGPQQQLDPIIPELDDDDPGAEPAEPEPDPADPADPSNPTDPGAPGAGDPPGNGDGSPKPSEPTTTAARTAAAGPMPPGLRPLAWRPGATPVSDDDATLFLEFLLGGGR